MTEELTLTLRRSHVGPGKVLDSWRGGRRCGKLFYLALSVPLFSASPPRPPRAPGGPGRPRLRGDG